MNIRKNSQFFLIGLVLSLIIAVFLSPFASPDPDGLDRVAEDLQFSQKEDPNALGHQLPSARIFDGYALKGVPEGVATPLAGFL
ncbi:MAG: PDGLE domain-containing protein, partial [Microcystis aeruginosa]